MRSSAQQRVHRSGNGSRNSILRECSWCCYLWGSLIADPQHYIRCARSTSVSDPGDVLTQCTEVMPLWMMHGWQRGLRAQALIPKSLQGRVVGCAPACYTDEQWRTHVCVHMCRCGCGCACAYVRVFVCMCVHACAHVLDLSASPLAPSHILLRVEHM